MCQSFKTMHYVFLFYWLAVKAYDFDNSSLFNVRGYVEYYSNARANEPSLNVVFDFDIAIVPKVSVIYVECSAFTVRSAVDCHLDRNCSQETGLVEPLWTASQTLPNIDYGIYFNTKSELDCYQCSVMLQSTRIASNKPWSALGYIHLSGCDRIKPKPSISVWQSSNINLQRLIEPDAANGPTDQPNDKFYQLENNSVVDEFADWIFSLNRDRTCLIRRDIWVTSVEAITIDCFADTLDDIVYYAPMALIFLTQKISFAKKQWRLIRFETATNRSKMVIDIDDAALVSIGCDRAIDHGNLAIDWRPYWTIDSDREGCVIFVSEGSLWSYNIGLDSCNEWSSLNSIGLNEGAHDEILAFDLDWSYFYWINSSTNYIHTFSWETRRTTRIEEVRKHPPYFEPATVIEKLDKVIDLSINIPFGIFGANLRRILDLNISTTTTDVSTGNLIFENVWNLSDSKRWANADQWVTSFRLNVTSICRGEAVECTLSQSLFQGRLQSHTVQMFGLVNGCRYTVAITANLVGQQNSHRQFSHWFVFNYEPPPDSPIPWWWYILGVFFFVLFLILIASLAGITIKRRRLRDFLNRQRIDQNQLTPVKKLGNGQFGEVWLNRYKPKIDNRQEIDVAVKISKPNTFASIANSNSEMMLTSFDCFFQEIIALKFLTHPNIIRALGVCSNYKDQNGKSVPALVLEYMNGGCAIDFVLEEKSHLTNLDLINIFLDVCSAGDHLNKMGVVHRDIGARNVLIKKNCPTGKSIIAKLTDFGLAKDVGKLTSMYKSSNRAVFHMRYTAPEGFRGLFSSQSDVWSFGIFVWEVYTMMGEIDSEVEGGPIPYSHLHTQEEILGELERGRRLEKPLMAPDEIYSIMLRCWAKAPGDRPSFGQVIVLLKSIQKSLIKNRLTLSSLEEGITYERLICDDGTSVLSVSRGEVVESLENADNYVTPNAVGSSLATSCSSCRFCSS